MLRFKRAFVAKSSLFDRFSALEAAERWVRIAERLGALKRLEAHSKWRPPPLGPRL